MILMIVGALLNFLKINYSGDHPTRLIYVTLGWLLQKLLHNTEFFVRCSHIVLDEIHERSIDSDLLYLLVKRMLITYEDQSPKLILMSAT
jgi:HrpA-like RNA helicase